MTVGLAFDYFEHSNIDFAVIEVGLGGRLDSTNVITPELSIITNISFDHTALLGNTLEKIAIEKAGIIKKGIPVIIGETHSETKSIFKTKAKESEIIFADQVFVSKNSHQVNNSTSFLEMDIFKNETIYVEKLQSELLGQYQQKNIPTVLAAIEKLVSKGYLVTEQQIRDGIKTVVKQTGLLGRWQILSTTPLTIADTGHNEAGIKEVLNQIQSTPHRQLHFVIGMVNDKDISTILKMLPQNAIYYFCKAGIPRALPATELAELAKSVGLGGIVFNSVKEALTAAQQAATKGDLVFVGGSTFTVAEVV
jgi:dihydrofolate synthase/folylpolyglutamate synthase